MSDILPESWKSSLTACRVTKPWSRIYIVFTELKKKSWLLLKFYFKDLRHLCLAHTICHIQLFPHDQIFFTVQVLKFEERNLILVAAFIYTVNHSFTHSRNKYGCFLREGNSYVGKDAEWQVRGSPHFQNLSQFSLWDPIA